MSGWYDVRYALRHFARRPGVAMTMIAVLAIGMAVAAGLFSFVRWYAVEPAPGIARADDLVRIRGSLSTPRGVQSRRFDREELDAQIASTSVFGAVAGWTNAVVAVARRGADDPDWVTATFVTDRYFEVLGVRPAAGAGLPMKGNEAPALVAVISRALRERHFASDAEAIGATLVVAGRPVTIVGVAPARFAGTELVEAHPLWLPDAARPLLVRSAEPPLYSAAARLRPGIDFASASAAMRVLATNAAIGASAPGDGRDTPSTDVLAMAVGSGDPDFEREAGVMAAMLSLLGVLVLLVTGTNASALQTGIAMTRGREIAMRMSLGASRGRVMRQLLVESGVLGLAAGVVAISMLLAAERLGAMLLPESPFRVTLDGAVIAFTFAVALAAGVLAGLSPALHASRAGVAGALKATSGGTSARRGGLLRGLVVAQVLLTQPLVVLLTAMVLVIAGEYRRAEVLDVAHEIVQLQLRSSDVALGPVDPTRETERLVRRLQDLPGVARAIPDPSAWRYFEGYVAEGSPLPAGAFELDAQGVAPGWFETMGRTLRLGRAFEAADAAPLDARHERPIVVGEDLAAALWTGVNPVGRRLAPAPDSKDPPLVVVGVAETTKGSERQAGKPYGVYLPAPSEATRIALLIRMRGDAAATLREIRVALHEAAPGLGIVEFRTLAESEYESRGTLLLATGVLGGLGMLALLIAAVGLYAVVAFAVTQRTGEIAVRLAVGARAGQVVRRTMREGLRLTAIGLVVGLPASLVGFTVLVATPRMIPPVPLWQVAAIAMLGISAIAAAATWIPARRAARVQPATVLRGE